MTDRRLVRAMAVLAVLLGASACTDTDSEALDLASDDSAESAVIADAQVATAGEKSATSRFKTVAASEVLGSGHPSLIALSVEEAQWLDRHGYPTREELAQVRSYDVDLLESAMRNRKDVKAAALLGHRRALEGDLAGAASAFSAAASQGSLYARQQLAIANMQDITGLPDDRFSEADPGALVILMAQMEMTKQLGDHRAQTYIDRFGEGFDWNTYGRHVLNQTGEFMRQYGENARAVGMRPLGPDPRPNADLWHKLRDDPSAMVTVYQRAPGGG